MLRSWLKAWVVGFVCITLCASTNGATAQPVFAPSTELKTDGWGWSYATSADIDGDGDMDIVGVAQNAYQQSSIVVAENVVSDNVHDERKEQVMFLSHTVAPFSSNGVGPGVKVLDLDRDGTLDIVLGCLFFLKGVPGKAFKYESGVNLVPGRNTPGPSYGVQVSNEVLDLNDDGCVDAVCNGEVFFNDCSSTLSFSPVPLGMTDSCKASGTLLPIDMDGDGFLDLLPTSYLGFNYLQGTGRGFTCVEHSMGLQSSRCDSPVVADVDGDGDDDVACASAWIEHESDMSWVYHAFLSQQTCSRPCRYEMVDLDRDGDLDRVNVASGGIQINNAGYFLPGDTIRPPSGISAVSSPMLFFDINDAGDDVFGPDIVALPAASSRSYGSQSRGFWSKSMICPHSAFSSLGSSVVVIPHQRIPGPGETATVLVDGRQVMGFQCSDNRVWHQIAPHETTPVPAIPSPPPPPPDIRAPSFPPPPPSPVSPSIQDRVDGSSSRAIVIGTLVAICLIVLGGIGMALYTWKYRSPPSYNVLDQIGLDDDEEALSV